MKKILQSSQKKFANVAKITIAIISLILLFSSIVSCSTTKTKVAREPDENYLGDFDHFQLENGMSVVTSFGNIKPKEIELWCVPRTNIIEAHFRDNVNKIALMWSYDARKTLIEAITMYMTKYEEGSLQNIKTTNKNAFNSGKISIAWGVAGLTRNANTIFYTNYEYLEENKPYFRITLKSASSNDDSSVYSPNVNLYFSPTQLQNLSETVSNEVIGEYIKELENNAYSF